MVEEPQEYTTAAHLIIQEGPRAGKRLEIWKDLTTIGRSRDCDIFLEDISVHRKQASIMRTVSGFILRDDHGKGDSYVNGQSVNEQLLKHGDQLLLVIQDSSSTGTKAPDHFSLLLQEATNYM